MRAGGWGRPVLDDGAPADLVCYTEDPRGGADICPTPIE